MNLYTAFRNTAAKYPTALSIREGGRDYTFAQVLAGAERVLAGLLAAGLRPGDRVALLVPNSHAFVVSFFGVLGAGGVVLPLNLMLQPEAILNQIRHAGARFILTVSPLLRLAKDVSERPEDVKVLRVEDILESNSPKGTPQPAAPNETAALIYTSGTTGNPKGVMLSHRNLYSNFSSFQAVFGFREIDRFVSVLPFFHSFGLTTNLLVSELVGASIEILPRFHPLETVRIASRAAEEIEGRVVFLAVASMFALMARVSGDFDLARNHLHISGGAALPNRVFDDFQGRFGAEILQGYGLTEASPVVAVGRPDLHKKGTIGHPIPGVKTAIWNDANEILPHNREGELMVRGANVMAGYYRNPEATSAALTPNGWLHTGDLGFIDPDGFITISGRSKELIISAGENIHPQEIEEILLDHPKVAEAAVIGAPDPIKGEVPKAFIVPMAGKDLGISEIRSYCLTRLPEFKVPRYFDFPKEIPKLPTGKVDKRKLG
jgi:long-chain acyl-CoA synthetase